mmetsp:Transcript_14051/g.29568  ORF Transcript_14051/g.29568 Transcript_14051/m.29568 type:complete len:138 (+) Transcript_14051:3-416(+)
MSLSQPLYFLSNMTKNDDEVDSYTDDHQPTPSTASIEEEYIRLKLELAQTRAKTDTARLQARQLITKRDEIKDSLAASKAEAEEQDLILKETQESLKKLKEHLDRVETEKMKLWEAFERKGRRGGWGESDDNDDKKK